MEFCNLYWWFKSSNETFSSDEDHRNTTNNKTNEFRDETYSFRPWTIQDTDIETQSFKLKSSKISSDFHYNISIEFIRFGSFHLTGGFADFKSNRGISLITQSINF
jgi:hypothetical protein